MSTGVRVHDVVRVGRGSTDWVVQSVGQRSVRARTAFGTSRVIDHQRVVIVGHVDATTRVVTYSSGAVRAWPGVVPAERREPSLPQRDGIRHGREGDVTELDTLAALGVRVRWVDDLGLRCLWVPDRGLLLVDTLESRADALAWAWNCVSNAVSDL